MLLHVALFALAAAAEKPKLVVLDFQAQGVPAEAAQALTTAATQDLSQRGFFEVVTSADIQTLLGVERQKQLVGCSDGSSCTAELAGAMGSRFVLSGSVTKLGSAVQLSMQMLDTAKAQPVARSVRLANDVEALAAQLPWALAEATATPAPPAPSRVLPFTLIGVGGIAALTGAVLGVTALSRDFALREELAQPDTGIFKPAAFYRNEAASVGQMKTIALATVLSGAAIAVAGIFLIPRDVRPSVALVPTHNGFAFAGVFQ